MRSSPSQWNRFRKSFIWKDIKDELNRWLEDNQAIIEEPDSDLRTIDRRLGSIEAIRNLLDFPRNMEEALIEDEN